MIWILNIFIVVFFSDYKSNKWLFKNFHMYINV